MILVTVGTHNQGFERLVRAVDELAGELDERMVIQYGASTYLPQQAEGFQWTTSEEMERLTSQARVVVSHAAAGAIILALRLGKPLVVVPRLKVYREHFDDHQAQLAAALAGTGRLVCVAKPTPQALRLAVAQTAQLKPPTDQPDRLRQALRRRLAGWEGER
ncbi:MAG TPA: glycosyltransferase [Anaerolineales bacterium]|nr:glycosyltransferase [Anaerolineales bacterium]